MPALYVALVVVGGWMVLATWGPLHRVDPYPFRFLLFLDNVVQLVLCLVILVGQRVLGAAADHRAVQTYEHAEAIFEQVADLQEHLDRHDRALSRGVSLLEWSPHPWIERHRVQAPPQAIDQAVTVNGRIAAWLTQRLGTMGAFYLAAGTQVAWIVLAEAGIQRFDPYPFAFMSFLSTLAQLIFMIVIMVGQDVLSRAADRRSQQTFLDAEAILHECRRMKVRLTAQDRVIDSLTSYVTFRSPSGWRRPSTTPTAPSAKSARRPPSPAARPLAARPLLAGGTSFPRSSRSPTAPRRGRSARCWPPSAASWCRPSTPTLDFAFDDDEVQLLARLEHERWLEERTAQGFEFGPVRGDRMRPDLVPWEQLSEEARLRNMQSVRRIPGLLTGVGFQVLRDGRGERDGPREADFDAVEWEDLQQAMLASGVLMALAEGAVAAGEIFALARKLRETSITHPRRFIRELAMASAFNTGLQAGTRYADYEDPALEAIRSAVAIVAEKAPAQLSDFRELLVEIAVAVADASKVSAFAGLGTKRRRSGTALAAVTRAAGLG